MGLEELLGVNMKDVRDLLIIIGMYLFAAYGFVHFLNDVGLLSRNFLVRYFGDVDVVREKLVGS